MQQEFSKKIPSIPKNYIQTDFLNLLFPSALAHKDSKKAPLPIHQQQGFRKDYNKAMITLYIIGQLFNTSKEKMPEEIKSIQNKAKKTQERYERYMPKAGQKIIHYGRDVVDAYISRNIPYLDTLTTQAIDSKHKDKWRICIFAQDTVDKMIQILQKNQSR